MSALGGPQSNTNPVGTLECEIRRLCAVIESRRGYTESLRVLLDTLDAAPGDEAVMQALEAALAGALEALDATDGSLLALDEDSGELVFVITVGSGPPTDLAWQRLPAGVGVADWVVRNRRACVVNDPIDDDRFYGAIDQRTGYHTRSLVAAPLIDGGRVLGVIEVLNKRGRKLFTTSDETRVRLLAHLAGGLLAVMDRRRVAA